MPVNLSWPSAPGAGLAGSYNGLTFDPGGLSGFALDTMQGLDDLPDVRHGDLPRGQDDGAFLAVDLLGERIITLTLHVLADEASYPTRVAGLKSAFMPQRSAELPLYARGSTVLVNCRTTKARIPQDVNTPGGYGVATIELTASDPRIYDANLTTIAVPVAVAGSGFRFPMTFPLTFGTAGTGGTFTATNLGNFPTKPTVHITGPVDNPRLEHTDSGKVITLAISLASGDYLDLDFNTRTIILNGTASRRNALVGGSAWWDILPGVNRMRYSANTVLLGSVATVTFRSAWI